MKVKIDWQIKWRINRAPEQRKTMTQQLITRIIHEFNKGNYPPDFQMPSVLKMQKQLKIDKRHIESAYKSLVKQNVLYTILRIGTFVNEEHQDFDAKEYVPTPEDCLPINVKGNFHIEEKFELNTLVLGHSGDDRKHDGYWNALKTQPRKLKTDKKISYNDFIFQHALRCLKNIKYISSSRQLCVLPERVTLAKVLQHTTLPEDQVAIVSSGDRSLTNLIIENFRKPVFVGSDNEGMLADNLRIACEDHSIKAVLVRRYSDMPLPNHLSARRYKELLRLSSIYKFWIIFIDIDHLSDRYFPVNPEVATGRVVHICPSHFLHQYYNVGLVSGPPALIEFLQRRVSPLMRKWLGYTARMSFFNHVMALKMKEIRYDDQTRTNNCRSMRNAFERNFKSGAELVIPDYGNFATIVLNEPINLGFLLSIWHLPIFYKEENSDINLGAPIKLIRVSLLTTDWHVLNQVLQIIYKWGREDDRSGMRFGYGRGHV